MLLIRYKKGGKLYHNLSQARVQMWITDRYLLSMEQDVGYLMKVLMIGSSVHKHDNLAINKRTMIQVSTI